MITKLWKVSHQLIIVWQFNNWWPVKWWSYFLNNTNHAHKWFWEIGKFSSEIGNRQHWVWYELEFTLNHDMSDIVGHLCDLNMQPLRPGQDCTTLWDYLRGLSPALQVLSFEGRQLQLHCQYNPKMTKWFKVHPIEIGMFYTEWGMSDIGSSRSHLKIRP